MLLPSQVCIIHAKGQITVAAYGSNTALVSYPSPSLQPHTLSFRLASEQLPEAVSGSLSGCFAYVRDGSHVCVQEVDQQQETKYAHDVEIDFLVSCSGLSFCLPTHQACACLLHKAEPCDTCIKYALSKSTDCDEADGSQSGHKVIQVQKALLPVRNVTQLTAASRSYTCLSSFAVSRISCYHRPTPHAP